MLPWTSQLELVHALLAQGEAARDLMGVLKPSHFPENTALGHLALTGLKLWEKYKQAPTVGQIREALQGDPQEGPAVSLLDDVLLASIPSVDWTIEKGRKHIAEAELLLLAGEMRDVLSAGSYDQVLKRTRDSLAIMSPRGQITEGAGTDDEVLKRHVTEGEAIPTGIASLDRVLGGGLQRGRLGCVLGKKGGGKSHALVWLGTAALLAGKRVMYVTLEMGEGETRARFDRAITGLPSVAFHERYIDVRDQVHRLHRSLRVVEATRRPLSVMGLLSVLDRVPLEGFPDILCLDYYQRLAGGGKGNSDNPQQSRILDLSETSRTLHEIAQDRKIAVWTAHQANRIGISQMKSGEKPLDTTSFAECIQSAWDMDVIVSVNQTIVEEMDKVARLFVCENRSGPSQCFVPIRFHKDTSRMEDVNQ